MKHRNLLPFDLINERRETIRNVNVSQRENLSKINTIALGITERVGSVGFFLIIFFWTVTWLCWNIFAPTVLKFDPYPAFVLWLFISNLIQIFLMPLIMISQNLQSKHAEMRAEEDFLVNKKAESEIGTVLMHLENQNELILQILAHLQQPKAGEVPVLPRKS